MRLIRAVFKALQSFDRPATRRELERESGLSKDEVWKGLKGLARRHMIAPDVLSRRLGTYRLVPGAKMPEDLRGRYVRDADLCERLRRSALGYHAARVPSPQPSISQRVQSQSLPGKYQAAAPPAPSNAPGGARLVVKGMLEGSNSIGAQLPPPCALADFWKRR